MVALVDDEDFDRLVDGPSWYAETRDLQTYARRDVSLGGGRRRRDYMHRVILPGHRLVDHVNGDGLDNRRANIRAASAADNVHNTRLRRDSVSGIKGVALRDGKWAARIRHDGSTRHLGRFMTLEEAGRAYDRAARELFGEFAALNFPGPSEQAA